MSKSPVRFKDQIEVATFNQENVANERVTMPSELLIDTDGEGLKYGKQEQDPAIVIRSREVEKRRSEEYPTEMHPKKLGDVSAERNLKTFLFESDWPSILTSSPAPKNQTLESQSVAKSIQAAEKFCGRISTQNLLSFNCYDLNAIFSMTQDNDSQIFVLRIQNQGLSRNEMERLLLPVFLVMSNLFTDFGKDREDRIGRAIGVWQDQKGTEEMLDEVLSRLSGEKDVAQKILDQAKILQKKITDTKPLLAGTGEKGAVQSLVSQVIETLSDEIVTYLNEVSGGKILAESVETKNLSVVRNGRREMSVEKQRSPEVNPTNLGVSKLASSKSNQIS